MNASVPNGPEPESEPATTETNNSDLLLATNPNSSTQQTNPITFDYVNNMNHNQQQHHQQPILCPADFDPNCILVQDQMNSYTTQTLSSSYNDHQSSISNHNRFEYQQPIVFGNPTATNNNNNYATTTTASFQGSSDHNNDNNNHNHQFDHLNQIDSQLSQTWAGPATSHQVASSSHYHSTTTTTTTNYPMILPYQENNQHQAQIVNNNGQLMPADDSSCIIINNNQQLQQQFNEQSNYQSYEPSYEHTHPIQSQYNRHSSSNSTSPNAMLQMQHQQLMRSLPPTSSTTRKYASQQHHIQ